jgi:cysteine synthase
MANEFPGVEIYGKENISSPGGSVKDRPALNMILEGAERSVDSGR